MNGRLPILIRLCIKWLRRTGEGAGYVNASVSNQEEKRVGRIHTLAVAPAYQAKGLGRCLLARSVEDLRITGADVVELSVETDNPSSAMGLYASLGFRPFRQWTAIPRKIGIR